jgi:MFS family permease
VRALGWSAVNRNVWLIGLTSFFSDVSSEMITSIFPIYLTVHLQLSPLAFGAIDGLQQGGASLFRLAGGVVTDRWRRYRAVAGAGYVLSALCRLGLLLAGRHTPGLLAVTVLDRLGKGMRTSPRDALISLHATRDGLASAFGVHRMLDTAGSMCGPFVAFTLLWLVPGGYDVVFVVSFAAALLGVTVLAALVRDPVAQADQTDHAAPPGAAAAAPWWNLLRGDGRVRTLVLCSGALGLATMSDGFIYLVLQQGGHVAPAYLPLLFVATPAAYMLLAAPVGMLADRAGRSRVLVAGYGALLGAYAVAALSAHGAITVAACVVLLGAYYAATDGVMSALTSSVVPASRRATGLAVVGTANDAGKVLAGLTFGWLWSRHGTGAAIGTFGTALLFAMILAAGALGRRQAGAHA